METRLHSYDTYFYKYCLPVLWFPWDGFRSARRAFPPTDPHHSVMLWLAIIGYWVTYGLVVFYGVRLKTVFINETGLRIRGYVTEIEIPFAELASVKHNYFFKNDSLFLKAQSAFGDKILFIARRRVATEHGKMSTLEMLRNLIT